MTDNDTILNLDDIQELPYTPYIFDATQPNGTYPVTWVSILATYHGGTFYALNRGMLIWNREQPDRSSIVDNEIIEVIEVHGRIVDGQCLDIARRFGTETFPAFDYEGILVKVRF